MKRILYVLIIIIVGGVGLWLSRSNPESTDISAIPDSTVVVEPDSIVVDSITVDLTLEPQMSFTGKDAHTHYVQHGGQLSWNKYKEVVSDFNREVMDRVIVHAEIFDMGSGLSSLSILRVKSTFANPLVNWPESERIKAEVIAENKVPMSEENPDGEPWLVFYDTEWYCRFYWRKSACKIRNKSAYRFDATRGIKGNKGKLIKHLTDNELAYLDYELAA